MQENTPRTLHEVGSRDVVKENDLLPIMFSRCSLICIAGLNQKFSQINSTIASTLLHIFSKDYHRNQVRTTIDDPLSRVLCILHSRDP